MDLLGCSRLEAGEEWNYPSDRLPGGKPFNQEHPSSQRRLPSLAQELWNLRAFARDAGRRKELEGHLETANGRKLLNP